MSTHDTLPPTDPRAIFAAAVRTAGDLVHSVHPDELANATPCDDMDVQGMLGHLLMVLDRVAALGNGDDPMHLADTTTEPADGWPAAWSAAAERAAAAWADDATLERPMALPWVAGPGAVLLSSYIGELTVHTWDLSRGLGRPAAYDDRALAVSLQGYELVLPAGDREALFDEVRAKLPEEFRSGPPPFRNPVEVPADAPLIDRIVAWSGRRP